MATTEKTAVSRTDSRVIELNAKTVIPLGLVLMLLTAMTSIISIYYATKSDYETLTRRLEAVEKVIDKFDEQMMTKSEFSLHMALLNKEIELVNKRLDKIDMRLESRGGGG